MFQSYASSCPLTFTPVTFQHAIVHKGMVVTGLILTPAVPHVFGQSRPLPILHQWNCIIITHQVTDQQEKPFKVTNLLFYLILPCLGGNTVKNI